MLRRPIALFYAKNSRCLTSSSVCLARALVYSRNGEPADVLQCRTVPGPSLPAAGEIRIRFSLSPINPADLNVIQGAYPTKPRMRSDLGTLEPVCVAGNEGLAVVEEVGSGVSDLTRGDWVILSTPQFGTWITEALAKRTDVIRVPRTRDSSLTEVQAATMTVNPATALALLREFVPLTKGDWVIQNGANSSVGQAVIQVARNLGFQTINLVRDRDNIDDLKQQLKALGAAIVLTYTELADKSARNTLKELTNGKPIRLGLNCVGGKDNTLMARFLGSDAHLVSYGAMSKAPVSLPTSLFIFKNLTCHGYWQSRWYEMHTAEQRRSLIHELAGMMEADQLKEPRHEIVTLQGTDQDIEGAVKEIIARGTTGRLGKKVLLRFAQQ